MQVFISSTYIDLKEERQAAVEAILDAGHIPAGMELFKAGNEDQLKTIKRWIDESDVYMLILGGRYGSIEQQSGKSYTHLEYEYAIEKGKPVFATVLESSFLYKKVSLSKAEYVLEQNEPEKYEAFKALVHTKVIKPVEDIKDIKIAVHSTLSEFQNLYEFSGWVRGSEVQDNSDLIEENAKLLKENNRMQQEIFERKGERTIGDFLYEDIKEVLLKKKITIPPNTIKNEKEISSNALNLFVRLKGYFVGGVTNGGGEDYSFIYIYYNIAPHLMIFGLLEKVKVPGVKYDKIQISKDGNKFLAYYELEKGLKPEPVEK